MAKYFIQPLGGLLNLDTSQELLDKKLEEFSCAIINGAEIFGECERYIEYGRQFVGGCGD